MEPKHKPAEVYNALQQLGLNEDILRTAILTGEFERDNCTPHDPRCVPGVFAWSRCSRSLRDQLIPRGWIKNDDQNRALVISPDERTAISVETGDEGTGKPDLIPNTKYQKGEATKKAINANNPTLWENVYFTADEIFEKGERIIWLLLRRRTEDVIYSELSLPARMVDGKVERWLERIILEPIPHDFNFNAGQEDDSGEIDIVIQRRQ